MKVNESSPPGFKGTTKAMKKHPEIDNAFALSWWMKKKGYEAHYKDKEGEPQNKAKYKNESFLEYMSRRDGENTNE